MIKKDSYQPKMDSTFSLIKSSIFKNSKNSVSLHSLKSTKLKTVSFSYSKKHNVVIWLIILRSIRRSMMKKWPKKSWKKYFKIFMPCTQLGSFTGISNLRTFCLIITWIHSICFWLTLDFPFKKICQEIQLEKSVQELWDS